MLKMIGTSFGILAVCMGAAVSYGSLNAKQENTQILVVDHEQRLDKNDVLDMKQTVLLEQASITLKELREDIRAGR